MNDKIVEDRIYDILEEFITDLREEYDLDFPFPVLRPMIKQILGALTPEPVQVEWERGQYNSHEARIGLFALSAGYESKDHYWWELRVKGALIKRGFEDSLKSAQIAAIEFYNTNIANRPEVRMG